MNQQAKQKPPGSITFSLTVIFIALAVFWLANYYIYTVQQTSQLIPATFYHYTDASLLATSVVQTVITLVLMVGIYYAKNWGRYIYIIYILARIIYQASTHAFHLMPNIALIMSLLYCALQLIAFISLFHPNSQHWFRYGSTA